jgi:hypothetical protein
MSSSERGYSVVNVVKFNSTLHASCMNGLTINMHVTSLGDFDAKLYAELRITAVFGLCRSSGILETRKHNVSETGSLSVLKWGGGRRLLCWVP